MKAMDIRKIIETGLASIAPEADFDELSPTENIREELDIDSFDFLNFLIGLNEKLGIDIPEADYEKLVSMNDLVNYLDERTG
ncbi:MAG: phosphopantetheine-binding protein [Deltaproteobacteria bacterium]|jgi:acyl carrier protein|nr:phosphopantetheine-binding protein [Deltaproteobacteria bacterium]MCW8892086.1 phosphopantetheine-binding protein [Deltaproteobacteria bacterium]MCW9049062.1 phosphopantetheine-binding protein [Deltaproteobacteria bacterium]